MPSRAKLRSRLQALRRNRSQERESQRDYYFESLRQERRYVYVPHRSSAGSEQYQLADGDDLTSSLTALLGAQTAPDFEAASNNLSVCHVPFTVLDLGVRGGVPLRHPLVARRRRQGHG
jgi:hypothetical protein